VGSDSATPPLEIIEHRKLDDRDIGARLCPPDQTQQSALGCNRTE